MNKKFELKQNNRFKFMLNYFSNLFFLFCIIVALGLISLSLMTIECEVDGVSMQPTLNSKGANKHDIVFVNKYYDDFKYEDIVVVKTNEKSIIKRIIGLPGDIIDIVESNGEYRIERNGEILYEDYILIDGSISTPTLYKNGILEEYKKFISLKDKMPNLFNADGKMMVPDNSLFVLGDNRKDTLDSCYYGTFGFDRVEGVVENVVYYGESEFQFYWNYIMHGGFFRTIFNAI